MGHEGKVIITCAVTGSIHTPSMSANLPVTAEEIAARRSAPPRPGRPSCICTPAIPITGKPTQTVAAYEPFLKVIKQRTDAVINITTGAGHGMTLEQRLEPARFFSPEVASLNMGSMNFGLFPMLNRYKDFKHDWEPKALENSRDFVFKNTFADIEYVLTTLAPLDVRFEFECYDIGHLYTLRHFLDRGLVKPPLFIQSVFGILGGIGTHPEDVAHMRRTADRLFGDQYHWSVLGAGRSQMRIAAMAAAMGGNVRVGLEDSLWKGQGQLATNQEQVRLARQIVEGLGLTVATPDEAREILQLKGKHRVNI